MTSFDDDLLLDELRRVFGAIDPVPAPVQAAARAAIEWRTIDAELAALVSDSMIDEPLLAVRGTTELRMLTFEADELTIELEAEPAGDDTLTLVGQLVPPQRAQVAIRHGADVIATQADERGRFVGVRSRCRPGQLESPSRRLLRRAPARRDRMAVDLTLRATTAPSDLAAMAEEAHRLLGEDPARARELATEALEGAIAAGLHETASVAHRAMGIAALHLDDAPTAVELMRAAIAVGSQSGLRAARRRGPHEPRPRAARARGLDRRAAPSGPCDARGRSRRRASRTAARPDPPAPWPRQERRSRAFAARSPCCGEPATATAPTSSPCCATAGSRTPTAARCAPPRPTCGKPSSSPAGSACRCTPRSRSRTSAGSRSRRGDLPAALEAFDAAEPLFDDATGVRRGVLEVDRCHVLLAAGLQREAQTSARRAIELLSSSELAHLESRGAARPGRGRARLRGARRGAVRGRASARGAHPPAASRLGRPRRPPGRPRRVRRRLARRAASRPGARRRVPARGGGLARGRARRAAARGARRARARADG